MMISVRSEREVTVSSRGDALFVEQRGALLSGLQLLAASLGRGALEALREWGDTAGIDSRDLSVTVRWLPADGVGRPAAYEVDIDWPALPAHRHRSARRAVQECSVVRTLGKALPIEIAFGR